MTNLLEMRGIVRCFGAVRANDGIDLDVAQGQIVGLLGENGSGKSTLMKLLFGMLPPDAGSIVFKGRELSGHRPAEAMAAGLAMIHQHFMLIEAMSVVENVMLGWPAAGRVLRRARVAADIREASARFGLDLDPDAVVADLPLGRRQRVEILKAILRGADLLILDEPTSNLAPTEVAGLLGILRRLRAEGRGIVFITHKLPEVLDVCDEVVVLRAGRVAGRAPVAGVSRAMLAEMMVGRDTTHPHAPDPRPPGEPLLVVRDLRGPGLDGMSFDVRAGEILGVAGVDGNGQLELADTLAGLRPAKGSIRLSGQEIGGATVAERVRAGLAYLPADRARTSLVRAMTVAENLVLRNTGGAFPSPAARTTAAARLMAAYDIRAPGPDTVAARLSGGNQQKIVIARELDRAPSVVIAHQAAWGLDPGATRFVLDRVVALRNAGAAVLYISSELEEVMAIGDRIAVLSGGRIAGILPRAEADLGRIGLWMAGQAA
jgi:simple sugar transport system ATP-binding protein